jgi:hypothetical protein
VHRLRRHWRLLPRAVRPDSVRTLSAPYAEIPQGLVGRESQCLSMQEWCVLICEVDKSSWDGAGCVLAAWQVIIIRRARPGRRVTPSIAPHAANLTQAP